MISQEILNQVRFIEFETKKILNSIKNGTYTSSFKGQGMVFSEVREYTPGDDTRHIDWNITAKTGIPHTKKFIEEREMTLMLAIDMSASGEFGSTIQTKQQFMASISALLSFVAISNNDLVGLLLFTDKIEKFLPPRKGKQHVLRITQELLSFRPQNKKTDINIALKHLLQILKRKSIIFLLSDFYSPPFLSSLKIINQKHNIIAINVYDKRERTFPKIGIIDFVDTETNKIISIDSSSPETQKLSEIWNNQQKKLKTDLSKIKIDFIKLMFQKNFSNSIRPLILFFKNKKKYDTLKL